MLIKQEAFQHVVSISHIPNVKHVSMYTHFLITSKWRAIDSIRIVLGDLLLNSNIMIDGECGFRINLEK